MQYKLFEPITAKKRQQQQISNHYTVTLMHTICTYNCRPICLRILASGEPKHKTEYNWTL